MAADTINKPHSWARVGGLRRDVGIPSILDRYAATDRRRQIDANPRNGQAREARQ